MLATLQSIERATGGWGMSMRFFHVPYLLDGPWYDTWLTAAVVVFALFVYGIWHGIVYIHHPPRHGVVMTAPQCRPVTRQSRGGRDEFPREPPQG
jgi:hypothetical protein